MSHCGNQSNRNDTANIIRIKNSTLTVPKRTQSNVRSTAQTQHKSRQLNKSVAVTKPRKKEEKKKNHLAKVLRSIPLQKNSKKYVNL